MTTRINFTVTYFTSERGLLFPLLYVEAKAFTEKNTD